jgi:hypothetical protein
LQGGEDTKVSGPSKSDNLQVIDILASQFSHKFREIVRGPLNSTHNIFCVFRIFLPARVIVFGAEAWVVTGSHNRSQTQMQLPKRNTLVPVKNSEEEGIVSYATEAPQNFSGGSG